MSELVSMQAERTTVESAKCIGPTIAVVSWEHTPQSNMLAADAVHDCDVIAVEDLGFRSDSQRTMFEKALTTYVSTASEAEITASSKRLPNNGITLPLFNKLQGTDKRVVTFDANINTLEIREVLMNVKRRGNLIKKVHRIPNTKVKAQLRDIAGQIAQSNVMRESKDVEQLTSLTSEYEGKDATIGVLIGANHTPVYHALSKKYPTIRRYAQIPFEGQRSNERIYYPPTDKMSRHGVFMPGIEIPEPIVDRAILHITQVAAASKGVATNNTIRARRVEDLPDALVSELVMALDGVKKGMLARLRPKRTLSKMDAMIETKLLEAEQRRK